MTMKQIDSSKISALKELDINKPSSVGARIYFERGGEKADVHNLPVSKTWQADWKEFIKRDAQWDFMFFHRLIVHKLELMKSFFNPDKENTILCKQSVKRIYKQICKALELADAIEDDEWIYESTKGIENAQERTKAENKLRKQANGKFFLYLATHYENWWC